MGYLNINGNQTNKWKRGAGASLLGVYIMLLVLFLAIMFAQVFAVRQEAQSLQNAADTIADGVAVFSMQQGVDYQGAVTEAGRIRDALEDTTGVRIDSVSIDRSSYENEQTADVTVTANRNYFTRLARSSNYVLSKTAGTRFSSYYGSSGYSQIDPSIIPAGSTAGEEVIRYALQFVGDPYVWGGAGEYRLVNHLGVDCSGFVQAVYHHFGASIPRTSSEQRHAGVPVPARIEAMRPGDIVCYSGHVALYIGPGSDGRGLIVHASSPRYGIKVSRNPFYRDVITVRRIFEDTSTE